MLEQKLVYTSVTNNKKQLKRTPTTPSCEAVAWLLHRRISINTQYYLADKDTTLHRITQLGVSYIGPPLRLHRPTPPGYIGPLLRDTTAHSNCWGQT